MTFTLMIQGTTSDAGKSAVATGLCRVLVRRGVRVAPFKPQNMALNSAVTADGGEIGRAQAVQAQACGLEPLTDMNPVLLKPNSDTGSQVIVQGRAVATLDAAAYHAYKPRLMAPILESYRRLGGRFDGIIVEGAGSPAEINLREHDLANMGFAEAVDCPVLLVGDIERGGVFAHLAGTLALLSESERARVKGLIINRFRGDPALLQPGVDWLERHTGKPVLGVLPYLHGLHLEAEDSLSAKPLVTGTDAHAGDAALHVVVPRLPRLSNHTDFDALALHPQVRVSFVGAGEAIPPADLVILPGSKSVRADLTWLRQQGWEAALLRHLRYGGRVLGICGGFQMLGRTIADPRGMEGPAGDMAGLGLLDMDTVLETEKTLARVDGALMLPGLPDGVPVTGYEIHLGVTTGAALQNPAVALDGRTDGARSADGQVLGTYLHGLFDHPDACRALLQWAGLRQAQHMDYRALRETHIERLADMLEAHLDWHCLGPLVSP